ncbi:MAG: hypothetical protein FWD73_11480 [Polyangiaceae bacterium]|nr:hypothetical protein [Polyangiaceae bacterium]
MQRGAADPIRTSPTIRTSATKGVAVKRLAPIFVLLAACSPDIESAPPSSVNAIVVQFDPGAAVPVVPQPNDLARDPTTGKIVVPASPTDTPAQVEFNRDYLGNLTGFPLESTAQVLVTGDLDPQSVNPQSVLAFDLTDVTSEGAPTPQGIKLQVAGQSIVVAAPDGGWTRAHQYAMVVVGGPNGVRGAKNENVIGSQTWYLVSGTTPLVTCSDLASPTCAPTVDIIPSTETDIEARLVDQTHKAITLEQIRRGYAPLLGALEAQGIARQNVAILWTFTVVDAGEMTFDPANQVIPFPNDVLLANGQVNLPNPSTGAPLTPDDCASSDATLQLYCGLNTLDGFSTTAPLISENSDTLGAALQANINPDSLAGQSVGLLRMASRAPEAGKTDPNYTPCLNCMSSKDTNGNLLDNPQQLQWKLNAPLDEQTTYFAYVTSGVTDDENKPVIATAAMALVRLSNPLVDENGKSTVNIVSDEQAAQLEPLRVALKPAFDAMDSAGVPRANIALAFPFTTQSEASVLDQLYAIPSQVPGLPDYPVVPLTDATDTFSEVPGGVEKIFVGAFFTPVAITGAGGTLNPANPQILPVNFLVAVPSVTAPAGGYPVTIFGHGLGGSRNDALDIASALAAKGQVVIAADWLFHGDRTSCTGASSVTPDGTDDEACADPGTMKCDEGALVGLCVLADDGVRASCTQNLDGDMTCAAQGQGLCSADGKCQGQGAGPSAVVSGWNMFSLTNFFQTRDNFRQPVIDFAQLVRVIKSTSGNSLATQLSQFSVNGEPITLDTANINYLGQSLGGILGTNVNAVSPDTNNVVLNVPGGSLPQIILTSPAFAAQRGAFIGSLDAQGIKQGTPAFDQFVGIVQWILDPADPANMGYRLTHSISVSGVDTPNANRKAFIQFIEGDQVVPNESTIALIAGANRSFANTPPNYGCTPPLTCYEFTEAGNGFDPTTATPETRHNFLRVPPSGAAGADLKSTAQTQAVTFISTGNL